MSVTAKILTKIKPPPFDQQVKALFDQFPWEKAELVLRILSSKKGVSRQYPLANKYSIEDLKTVSNRLLSTLEKMGSNANALSTAHMRATRDSYGYYGLELDISVDPFIDNTDFFMDGRY